jgi:hypothetical protein
MPKRSIVVYIEPPTYERVQKAKTLRERVSPPGWKSISSYAAHLLEEGLKVEEVNLEEEQAKETRRKKDDRHDVSKHGS